MSSEKSFTLHKDFVEAALEHYFRDNALPGMILPGEDFRIEIQGNVPVKLFIEQEVKVDTYKL